MSKRLKDTDESPDEREAVAAVLGVRDDETILAAAERLAGEVIALRAKLAAVVADGGTVPDSFAAGDKPPPVDADKGDMTPAYARWMVATQPIECVRAQYAGREEHLPEDVREALKKEGA